MFLMVGKITSSAPIPLSESNQIAAFDSTVLADTL